jgi:hypothetical protein
VNAAADECHGWLQGSVYACIQTDLSVVIDALQHPPPTLAAGVLTAAGQCFH